MFKELNMAEKEQKMSSIETRLQSLEEVTTKLESGQLNLDEAIAAYTKGLELVLSCRKSLDEMSQKIEFAKKKILGVEIDTQNNDESEQSF